MPVVKNRVLEMDVWRFQMSLEDILPGLDRKWAVCIIISRSIATVCVWPAFDYLQRTVRGAQNGKSLTE